MHLYIVWDSHEDWLYNVISAKDEVEAQNKAFDDFRTNCNCKLVNRDYYTLNVVEWSDTSMDAVSYFSEHEHESDSVFVPGIIWTHLPFMQLDTTNFEVIGNIYENPELLEDETK